MKEHEKDRSKVFSVGETVIIIDYMENKYLQTGTIVHAYKRDNYGIVYSVDMGKGVKTSLYNFRLESAAIYGSPLWNALR